MNRLTEQRKDDYGDPYILFQEITRYYPDESIYKALKKLAHYEDLEEQGRLIVLPCKVGDTVYYVNEDCNYIGDCRGMKCEHCIYHIPQICPDKVSSIQHAVRIMEQIGKTVFLTKEEAEAKLNKIKGEDNEL